jgi:hypothetical protein
MRLDAERLALLDGDVATILGTSWTTLPNTSVVGTSQHFAPPHDFGRKRGIAEVDGQPSIAEGDTGDPKADICGAALFDPSSVCARIDGEQPER